MGNSALPASAWRLAAGAPWGDMPLKYDLGDLRDTGAAVAVTLFRPSEDRAVLVVAASDQPAVEARLRPQLGVLLCVVPSRWTKAQLDEIRDYLRERREQWQLLGSGPHHTDDGQARMTARLARVLPEIAAWANSLPDGIVALDPWLAPQQPTASLSGLFQRSAPPAATQVGRPAGLSESDRGGP